MHVIEKLPSNIEALVASYIDDDQRKNIAENKVTHLMDRIKKRLKIFCDKELKDDPESMDRIESIEVCQGFPADEILTKADDSECDTIIMGTHGKGIIKSTSLGSVTKEVLRRVRKPVYIIPLPKGETDITFRYF